MTWQVRGPRKQDEKLGGGEVLSLTCLRILIHLESFHPDLIPVVIPLSAKGTKNAKCMLFGGQINTMEEYLPALLFHEFFLTFSIQSLGSVGREHATHSGTIPANRGPESESSVTFRKIYQEGKKRKFGLGIPFSEKSLTQAQFCWVLLHNGRKIC